MRRNVFTVLTIPATVLALGANAVSAAPEQYELDPDHTVIAYTVGHVGYANVLGIFGEVSGTFGYDTETQELSDVAVTIGAASFDTFHDARDVHVNSGDFLDTATYPEITFVASEGAPEGDASGTVTGDLTLLGQTHPATLNVTLKEAEAYPFGHGRFTLGLSMTAEIERSTWGMPYGVDNGLVGDTINIMIETEAMQIE